ncbi:MAG: hypothetical protein JXK07_09525 [Spirochaetes bacterium]|nr:hypothetical protein [Spirochaetota bacterium]MBN2770414.1 hypothetical protein [Spirochaetota bacterium]
MRIDDKTYNLKLGGIRSVTNRHTTVKRKINDANNNIIGSDFGINHGTDTIVNQYSYKEFEGKLIFTKKIEEAILTADKVAIRFYAGSKPLTITIEDGVTSSGTKFQKLTNLKKFLKANGS